MNKDIIERLISYPQRGQIQIDFDAKKQFFRLSVPVFSSIEGLPAVIKDYVDARKNSTFQPHITSYQLQGHKVLLIQEIPFALDFQSTLRIQADQFWQMSQHCHKMLSEIAAEETYKNAISAARSHQDDF